MLDELTAIHNAAKEIPISRSSTPSHSKAVSGIHIRPKLYPEQSTALFDPLDVDGNPARCSWIKGSTKSGKTDRRSALLVADLILLSLR